MVCCNYRCAVCLRSRNGRCGAGLFLVPTTLVGFSWMQSWATTQFSPVKQLIGFSKFAPGAEISNVSLQVHVNGSNGLMINEPLLVANDIGINLFDWRGLGTLGASDSFDGANPYSDRLSPNSASGTVGLCLRMQTSQNWPLKPYTS